MSRRNMFLLFACGLFCVRLLRARRTEPLRPLRGRTGYCGDRSTGRWKTPTIKNCSKAPCYGMVAVLRQQGDEHSVSSSTRTQKNEFREELTQEFGGVGIHYRLLGEILPFQLCWARPNRGLPPMRPTCESAIALWRSKASPPRR